MAGDAGGGGEPLLAVLIIKSMTFWLAPLSFKSRMSAVLK